MIKCYKVNTNGFAFLQIGTLVSKIVLSNSHVWVLVGRDKLINFFMLYVDSWIGLIPVTAIVKYAPYGRDLSYK